MVQACKPKTPPLRASALFFFLFRLFKLLFSTRHDEPLYPFEYSVPVLRCFLSSLLRFAFLLIRSEHGIGIRHIKTYLWWSDRKVFWKDYRHLFFFR